MEKVAVLRWKHTHWWPHALVIWLFVTRYTTLDLFEYHKTFIIISHLVSLYNIWVISPARRCDIKENFVKSLWNFILNPMCDNTYLLVKRGGPHWYLDQRSMQLCVTYMPSTNHYETKHQFARHYAKGQVKLSCSCLLGELLQWHVLFPTFVTH